MHQPRQLITWTPVRPVAAHWQDGRPWERATLREAPTTATWPATRPTLAQRAARWWQVIEFALAAAGAALFIGYVAGAIAVVTA